MTAPNVHGIDLSLTATGHADNHGHRTIPTRPADGTDIDRTRIILAAITEQLRQHPPDLIVIESPVVTARGSAIRTGALHGVIAWELQTRPVLYLPPATVKKYATGKGNANKTAMVVAARERLNLDTLDDNEADAAWLHAAGRDLLGHPVVKLPAAHRQALDKWRNHETITP